MTKTAQVELRSGPSLVTTPARVRNVYAVKGSSFLHTINREISISLV